MISAYLHLAWWLLPPALVLWWARRWLLTPWARYVSHSLVKKGDDEKWFVTVRHVRWYPPFADFDVTYRSFTPQATHSTWWAREDTGEDISDHQDRVLYRLVSMAETRKEETEELLKDRE